MPIRPALLAVYALLVLAAGGVLRVFRRVWPAGALAGALAAPRDDALPAGSGRGGRVLTAPAFRIGAGGLALVVMVAVMRLTAPPVPAAPVSPDAPPPQAVETMEGIVLAVAPGAAVVEPDDGGTTANGRGSGEGGPTRGTVLDVRLAGGSQRGRKVRVTLQAGMVPTSAGSAAGYRPGDRVVVTYLPQLDETATAPPTGAPVGGQAGPLRAPADAGAAGAAGGGDAGEAFRVVDHVRWPWLLWGVGALILTIAAVAGWMGLRALTGLSLAVCVLWWFVIPRLLAGQPPVPVAVAGCALIAIPALMLTHGPNREGIVPLLGIGGSLAVVGVLAASVVQLARLSGLAASEEISLVYVGTQGAVDPQGLLLAGMLVGVVGGLVDVTVGQSAAVFEFHDADPAASRRELFRRGMNVGRAHVAATVHTLVLAYAGAALPMLMLFAMYASTLGDVWNREMIVVEVVRSLAGSIGLAAAMPLTTWLACLTCRPAHHIEGGTL